MAMHGNYDLFSLHQFWLIPLDDSRPPETPVQAVSEHYQGVAVYLNEKLLDVAGKNEFSKLVTMSIQLPFTCEMPTMCIL